MNFIELAEYLVEHADMLAFHVLGRGGLDDVMADPAVDRGHEAIFHGTFDVAEQDDAVDVGRILRAVNECLVEHEGLTVAPDALLAVDQDPALVRIGRDEAQMMRSEPAKGSRCAPSLPPGGSMANIAPCTVGIEFKSSTVFGH